MHHTYMERLRADEKMAKMILQKSILTSSVLLGSLLVLVALAAGIALLK